MSAPLEPFDPRGTVLGDEVYARLGEAIVARTGKSETRGIFRTVDATGNLVLETAEGRTAIPAADVFF